MNSDPADAAEQFAAEAVRFRDWARDGTDAGELAARNALIRTTTLYLAALELPPEITVAGVIVTIKKLSRNRI